MRNILSASNFNNTIGKFKNHPIRSVIYLLVCVLIIFVAWKNVNNKLRWGCLVSKDVNGEYKYNDYLVTNKSVCYHEDCSYYGGDPLSFVSKGKCLLHKTIFGYSYIKNADPKTFVIFPANHTALDERNFYKNGKIENISPTEAANNLGAVIKYCQGLKEKNGCYYPWKTSDERMRSMCGRIEEEFKESKATFQCVESNNDDRIFIW